MFVSNFDTALGKKPQQQDVTVDEFERVCHQYALQPLVRARCENDVRDNPSMSSDIWSEVKTQGPCFSPVAYRPGTERKKENVESISAYCVDLDGVPADYVAGLFYGLETRGVRYWAWSTWGHGWKTTGECWRIVIPFASGVAVVDEPGLWLSVWSRLNEDLCGGINDRSTHDESRLHFYARAPHLVGDDDGARVNSPPLWRAHAGELYDPSAVVADARVSVAAAREDLARQAQEAQAARAARPTTEDHMHRWGAATLDGIVRRLRVAVDGEKHHVLRNMSFCAGGLTPHAVDVDDARRALRAVVSEWQADGRKIKSLTATEKLIESGLRKGASSPMYPDPMRETIDAPVMSDDEIDAMMREAGIEDEPAALTLVRSTPSSSEPRESQDERAERLWQMFAALGGVPSAYALGVEQRVDYRQPGIMLASGVALCSALSLRRLAYDGLTTTSIVCVIAPTASGKGAPQAFVEECLRCAWPEIVGPGDFSTSASFLARIGTATLLDHGLIYVVDEYGPQLKLMMNDKNIAQGALRPTLLRLSTCNTGTVTFATPMSGGGADRVMPAPGLCLYTSTTPEALHDAIGPMGARDGFLGRHLWFGASSRLPLFNRSQVREAPSSSLIDMIADRKRRWCAWRASLHLSPDKGNGGEELRFYRADVIDASSDARIHMDAFRDEKDEARRKEKSDTSEGLLGRQTEHAKRIALALADATCEGPAHPLVTMDHVRLACEIAEYSADVIGASMGMHVSGDRWDQQVGKVKRAMQRMIAAGSKFDRRDVMRAANMKRADLDEVLMFLKDTNQLGAMAHLAPKEAEKAKRGQE